MFHQQELPFKYFDTVGNSVVDFVIETGENHGMYPYQHGYGYIKEGADLKVTLKLWNGIIT